MQASFKKTEQSSHYMVGKMKPVVKTTHKDVLFIARRFPPSVGGMERFAYDLSSALAGVVHLHKITWGGSNRWLPIVLVGFFFRASWRLLIDRNISIIHMQDAVLAPIGWLLHFLFRKPYIVVAHGLDITYQSQVYQTVVLPFVRRASAVISISTATKDEAESRGIHPNISHVITLGIHDDYGKVTHNRDALAETIGRNLADKILLLTMGRLVKRKGVAWFVANVLPGIVEKNQNILYIVAGEGVERDNVYAAISEAGVGDYVLMLGRVSDEARMLLYQSCDVFVMPNIKVQGDMEGFGIVVHEAATAELPVVASNLEGIADALHNNKNGILVQSGDAETFIKQINQLIMSRKKRQDFGKRARRYTLESFSWHRIAEQYAVVYDQIRR